MNVLVIDTETTALTPETGELCEITAILVSLTHKAILSSISTLIPLKAKVNPYEEINKITPKMTWEPSAFRLSVAAIDQLLNVSDSVIAHNAEFDRSWVQATPSFSSNLRGLNPNPIPWVCSCMDVPWGNVKPGSSLIQLAIAHNIPVIPPLHRAYTDAFLLAQVILARPDFPQLLELAKQPKTLYVAQVKKPGTEAKQAGFVWNKLIPYQWAKWVRPYELETFNFPIYPALPDEAKTLDVEVFVDSTSD